MSAAPIGPEDGEKLTQEAMRFLPIGAAAMLARILMSQEKVSVGWATDGYLTSQGLRFAAVGLAGYAAPETADYALAMLRKRAEEKLAESPQRKARTKKK